MTDVAAVVAAGLARIREAGAPIPDVAIILGSGLGHVAHLVADAVHVRSDEIEGYPPSTVEGHTGAFVAGRIGEVAVAVLSGRVHGYEGHPAPVLGIPARILCGLNPKALVITNAAGGINPAFRPGDLMLIKDHLNLTYRSPLQGPNVDAWGPRFPDMSAVYPDALRTRAHTRAQELGLELREGVYACVPGPQYETPAEIRFLRTAGADAVGMSTVPEAIVASHMSIPVLGVSVISNQAAGLSPEPLSHDEVLTACASAGRHLGDLLIALLPDLRST